MRLGNFCYCKGRSLYVPFGETVHASASYDGHLKFMYLTASSHRSSYRFVGRLFPFSLVLNEDKEGSMERMKRKRALDSQKAGDYPTMSLLANEL